MSNIGYNFNGTSQAVTTTTDEGKQLVQWTRNPSVSSVARQLRTKTGTLISTVNQKKVVDENDVSGITPVKTSATTSSKPDMYGHAMAKWKASAATSTWTGTGYDHYAKNAQGVVTNTSMDDYEAAREAKRKRVAKEKEDEEMKTAVDVMKNELPADIQELKDIVAGLMQHLELEITDGEDADAALAAEQLAREIAEKKDEMLQYMTALLNYNRTSDKLNFVPIMYSQEVFDETFKTNADPEKKTDKEWADGVYEFVNNLVVANNFAKLSQAGTILVYEEGDTLATWVDNVLEYVGKIFDLNGYLIPEIRQQQKQELLNEISTEIVDEKLNAKIDPIMQQLGAIAETLNELRASTQYPQFIAIENKVNDYNAIVSNRASNNTPIQTHYDTSGGSIAWVDTGTSFFGFSSSEKDTLDNAVSTITVGGTSVYLCDSFVEYALGVISSNNDASDPPKTLADCQYNTSISLVKYFMDVAKLIPRVTA